MSSWTSKCMGSTQHSAAHCLGVAISCTHPKVTRETICEQPPPSSFSVLSSAQDLVDGLVQLGVDATCTLGTGCPPVEVKAAGLPSGKVRMLRALCALCSCGRAMLHLVWLRLWGGRAAVCEEESQVSACESASPAGQKHCNAPGPTQRPCSP